MSGRGAAGPRFGRERAMIGHDVDHDGFSRGERTFHRRRYVGWIESAKHEETKTRRLKEAIRLLSAGKELGLK